MNIADYIILAVVIISTLISLLRGFLKEFVSLFVWILGFWIALKFYTFFAIFFEPFIANETIRLMTGFAVVFLLVIIFGMLFNYALSFLVMKTGLSGTDRVIGMIFGCARGVLLVGVVLLLISSTSFIEDSWWRESELIPHFDIVVNWLREFLPQKMTGIKTAIQA